MILTAHCQQPEREPSDDATVLRAHPRVPRRLPVCLLNGSLVFSFPSLLLLSLSLSPAAVHAVRSPLIRRSTRYRKRETFNCRPVHDDLRQSKSKQTSKREGKRERETSGWRTSRPSGAAAALLSLPLFLSRRWHERERSDGNPDLRAKLPCITSLLLAREVSLLV